MGRPAARTGDPHLCPAYSGDTPHVGGPLTGPGAPAVLIGGQPAACVGDTARCNGPPDVVASGSATVLIGGRPAARAGDPTAHGGTVGGGAPSVLLGD